MNKFTSFALATVIAVSASATSLHAGTSKTTVDKSFDEFTFNWDEGSGLYGVWRPTVIDGKLAICGAYTTTSKQRHAGKFNKEVLKQGKALIDGTSFTRSLTFFKQLPSDRSGDRFIGQEANCKTYNVDVPADLDSVDIEFRSGNYTIKVRR